MPECWKKNLQKVEVIPVAAVSCDCSAPAPSHSPHQPGPFLAFTGPVSKYCTFSLPEPCTVRKQRIRQLDGFQKVMESNIITVPIEEAETQRTGVTFASPASSRPERREHLADICLARKGTDDDGHNLTEAVLATVNWRISQTESSSQDVFTVAP